MKTIHEFSTPRNLYEKLIRDSEKLQSEVSGDNVFNFISTACHLREWIKKSPMFSSEQLKRYSRRLGKNEHIKTCNDIIGSGKEFMVIEDESTGEKHIRIGENEFEAAKFREEIMELYQVFFKVKGQDA